MRMVSVTWRSRASLAVMLWGRPRRSRTLPLWIRARVPRPIAAGGRRGRRRYRVAVRPQDHDRLGEARRVVPAVGHGQLDRERPALVVGVGHTGPAGRLAVAEVPLVAGVGDQQRRGGAGA